METRRQVKKQKLEKAERKTREEDLEREKTLFVRKDKVIRKNDMITDPAMKKIKLDPGLKPNPAVVKQDVEIMQWQSSNKEAVDVTEEMNLKGMDVEEGVKVETVEEKVDLSDEDESCSSVDASLCSLQNVALTIKTIQQEKQKLKRILRARDAENEMLQTQLKQEQLQNKEQRSQAKAELQAVTDKLKKKVDQRDAEIECLKTQLKQREIENKVFEEQQSQFEADLETETKTGESLKELLLEKDKEPASQTQAIRSLRLQHEKMTELLAEKIGEVKSEAETSESLRLQIAKMKELNDIKICRAIRKDNLKEWKRKGDQHTDDENTSGPCLSSEETVLRLFQDVLEIFILRHGNQLGFVNWRNLLPILKMCRLVCKSWKESVDFILQHESCHSSLLEIRNAALRFDVSYSSLPLIFSTTNTEINSLNKSSLDLRKFLQHCDKMPPSYNPVPSRYILIIQDFSCWEDASRWQIVSKYLQQFGHQVWYLTVSISVGDTLASLELILQNLREMLELVPNIRSLALRTSTRALAAAADSRLELPSFPFPHLKHLETFVYSGHYDLFNCILASNQHIRRLQFSEQSICSTAFTKNANDDFVFPNLSHVSLYVMSEAWKRIVWANVKLEKLRLHYFYTSQSGSVEDIVQGLQNVGKTLKFLTLDLPHAEESMLAVGKVNLPLLRDLHITSRGWAPTNWENFLVQVESLETFSLKHVLIRQPLIDQKKIFVEFVNNFRGKTGWMKMLKLKLVTMLVSIIHNGKGHCLGKSVQVAEKRGKNYVLRFNLVSIDEKEIDDIFVS